MDAHAELLTRLQAIHSDDDRVLFQEAVQAAGAGAYRAAYIMVWVSCAESLKRRFRELAVRDSEAQRIIGDISRGEAAHQSVDMPLLTKAKDYGIINDVDFARLSHIFQMRSVFSHPYESQPSAAELVAASDHVVASVLSQPVRLRRGYIATQVSLLTERSSFLDDLQEPVAHYAQEVFVRVESSLHSWLLQKMFQKLEPLLADPNMALFVRRGLWFTTEYTRLMAAEQDAKWDVTPLLTTYPTVTARVFADPEVFPRLATHTQDIIVGDLLSVCDTSPDHLRQIATLHVSTLLNERQATRFLEKLPNLRLQYLSSAGIPPIYYANAIITALKSHDWYIQGPAVLILRALETKVATLPVETQLLLGNNLLQVADGTERAAINWMGALSDTAVIPSEAFVEGVVTECFVNEHGVMRFKIAQLEKALRLLLRLPVLVQQEILARLTAKITTYQVRYAYRFDEEKERAFRIMTTITTESEEGQGLEILQQAIAGLQQPE